MLESCYWIVWNKNRSRSWRKSPPASAPAPHPCSFWPVPAHPRCLSISHECSGWWWTPKVRAQSLFPLWLPWALWLNGWFFCIHNSIRKSLRIPIGEKMRVFLLPPFLKSPLPMYWMGWVATPPPLSLIQPWLLQSLSGMWDVSLKQSSNQWSFLSF